MTANQIAYWNLQETKRSNRAAEAENYRSHTTNERETARNNRAVLGENYRHSYAMEGIESRKLDEAIRNNNLSFRTKMADISSRYETARADRASREKVSQLDRSSKERISSADRSSRENVASLDRQSKEYISSADRFSKATIAAEDRKLQKKKVENEALLGAANTFANMGTGILRAITR